MIRQGTIAVVAPTLLVVSCAARALAASECVELPTGTATISGTITSQQSSQPVFAGLRASAQLAGYGPQIFAGISALDGSYTVEVAAPATYVLTALPLDTVHAPELYDGALTEAAATEITVSENEQVTGVDFTLLNGRSISGTIRAAGGAGAIPGVFVQASQLGDLLHFAFAESDHDGVYQLTGLAAVAYQVSFTPDQTSTNFLKEVFDDKVSFTGDPVDVSAANATGIDAELAMGGRIEGRVVDETASPVRVGLSPLTSGPYELGGGVSDPNGDYSLVVPSGTYHVFAGAAPGTTSEFFDDKPDLATANDVVVNAPQTTGNVDFQLDESGHILGRVTDSASGAGIEDVVARAYEATTGQPLSTATADASGNYDIDTNLRAGNYKIGFEAARAFDDPPTYTSAFYSDQATLDAANVVVVPLQGTVASIDQELVPCDGGAACGDPALTTGAALASGEMPNVVTASDALFVLLSAVGIETCQPCICDVNNAAGVTASDALIVLAKAVGLTIELSCPPCST